MQNRLQSGGRLGRQALLFPLCLVLYEFSTYIGNDMIQPGMLAVVEQYQAGLDWVPTSMTAYLAGGMFLQWLLGPLSDRIGRRPVMLAGVVWFYCHLPGDVTGEKHRTIYLPAFFARD